MKNNTITKAIEIGVNFENSQADTIEELHQEIIEFLHENSDKLEKNYQECEVTSHGHSQNVNYGDFTSSGSIIDWSEYYHQPRKKINHSNFMEILEDGTPVNTVLWCWSSNENHTNS